MLNGSDSGAHLAGLLNPILSACSWPYEKTQQLGGVLNTKINPFRDITLKPLIYVLFASFVELTQGHKNTFLGLEV